MRETIRLIATNAEQTNLLALNDTVRIIGSIAGVIKRVNDYSRKIAESVENQSETTGQIVGRITDSVSVAESISNGHLRVCYRQHGNHPEHSQSRQRIDRDCCGCSTKSTIGG